MAQITPKQALDNSKSWLGDESGMMVADDGSITVEGNPPLTLELSTDDERLVVSHIREEPGAGAGRADAVMAAVPDRGTTLHVAAAVAKTGVTFTFTNPVYLDGFSRQALVSAVNELVSTVDGIGGTPAALTRVQPAVSTSTQSAPATQEPADEPATESVSEATDTAEVDPVATGWTPTHRVPAGGMRAWDEPDPSMQPASRLEPRVELQIAERRGDWARAVGSNGWTGWVDARKLEEMAPKSTGGTGTIDLAGLAVRPLPLIAAVGLVIAAFLPWVSVGGGLTGSPTVTTNSFEIALAFMWDFTAAGSPYLGILILVLAAGALFVAAAKQANPGLTMLVGVISIAVATLFVVQMFRGISDSGGGFSDVFDFLGFAPWVVLGSGVVLLAGARR